MIVYDHKEANTQPPNWLYLAEAFACALILIVSCKHLWQIVMLIVKIEIADIYTLNELIYFILACIIINIILFYAGLLLCKE